MARTLAEDMAADVETVFLNEDEFAESVAFKPANGPSRSIKAIVTEVMAPRAYEKQHLTKSRRIEVMVSRNAVTGITETNRGDCLTWMSETWSNPEVVSGDAVSQLIRFERKTIESAGRMRSGGL